MQAEVQKQALKDINSELLPTLNMYGYLRWRRHRRSQEPKLLPRSRMRLRSAHGLRQHVCEHIQLLVPGIPGRDDAFHQSAQPPGQGRSIPRRVAVPPEPDSSEQQQKGIRLDVRNSKFALEQAQAHVEAAQKARDLAQKTFDITKQERLLGAKSGIDT